MHYFESVIIADRKRIYRKGFEEFLAGQDQYKLKAPADTTQLMIAEPEEEKPTIPKKKRKRGKMK